MWFMRFDSTPLGVTDGRERGPRTDENTPCFPGKTRYSGSVGILEFLLEAMGPKARKELAAEAAKRAAKSVVQRAGDALYEKADEIREDVEEAVDERRAAKERVKAEEKRRQDAANAEAEVDAELAALKRRLES